MFTLRPAESGLISGELAANPTDWSCLTPCWPDVGQDRPISIQFGPGSVELLAQGGPI